MLHNRKLMALGAMNVLMHAELAENNAGNASATEGGEDLANPHINKDLIRVDTNPLVNDIEALVENKMIEMKEVSFTFRTVKSKDPVSGEESEFKRPTLKVNIPLITKSGVIGALQSDDKSTELVVDSVNQIIIDQARGQLNDKIDADPSIVLKPEDVELDKLSLAAIASMPKSARGAGIAKEAFQAFVADYKAVMQTPEAIELFPDHKPRSPEILDKHGILLAGKFNQVKSRQDVVGQMQGFLDIWLQVSKNAEEHLTVYEFLKTKAAAIMTGEKFDNL